MYGIVYIGAEGCTSAGEGTVELAVIWGIALGLITLWFWRRSIIIALAGIVYMWNMMPVLSDDYGQDYAIPALLILIVGLIVMLLYDVVTKRGFKL